MSVTSVADASAVAEVSQIAGLLKGATSVLLISHINPDADSLGSALALGLALESLGIGVAVAFDYPDRAPESLRGLPGQHLITGTPPTDADLVVSLDVASTGRLGGLHALLQNAERSVAIDHHASNRGFAQLNWIDPHAEATVVLVARLIDELGVDFTADIAANLYAGLATDTVNFRFSSAAGHALAGRLIDTGIDPEQVLRPITDTHPFRWLGMLGSVLSRAVLDPTAAGGRGLVSVRVSLADAAGLRQEELDSIIDIVRTAAEADVATVVKQTAGDTWQVSLRARDGVDVGRVATALGGGGHPRAAGYTFVGDHDALITQLRAALDVSHP